MKEALLSSREEHRSQSCNYADNEEVGRWLNNILKKAAPKIGAKC
jgi:hypothetical protein